MKKLLLCTITLFLFVFSLFGEELHRFSHVHEQDCHVHLSDDCHEITDHYDSSAYQFSENPCPLAVSLNFVRTLKSEGSFTLELSTKLISAIQNCFFEKNLSYVTSIGVHFARGPPLV